MGETRMTALDFRGLSKRDFENGATLDEIYRVFQERDTLRAQVERLRSAYILEWREDVERDHRVYPATLCRQCRLCRYRWHEHLGSDGLEHASDCPLAATAPGMEGE